MLKEGQRVHVEYDGVVMNANAQQVRVRDSVGRYHFYHYAAITVTPADPANWPPKVGDIWEAEDGEYFAHEMSSGLGAVIMEPTRRHDREYSVPEFKKLNPTLVRRRD